MKEKQLQPLTSAEKAFAEKNHDVIYKFLRHYGYSMEDYYNVVVFGYLKAVQVYHRNEHLRSQYSFSCIAWKQMQSEISNAFRIRNAKKRKPEEKAMRLDAECEVLRNIPGCKSAEEEHIEAESLMELLQELSELQRKIAGMRLAGCSNREIYIYLKIPTSTFYKELSRIKTILKRELEVFHGRV